MKTARTNETDEGERLVLTVVESSWLMQRFMSTIHVVNVAMDSSRFAVAVRRGRRHWDATDWRTRRRATGITLLAAAGTAVALNAGAGDVAGWMWLIPPGTAAAVGVLLIAASLARVDILEDP
jgi:hypothetical protein